ncbi:protein FAR1-RELATED SEQUENCE 9-like [Tripterygium wilfordii]|uniref:protein FAR1-RELATED SEQUENCE 9-like n=1 Tax=Tripterygium wilfordii TaxID=458696 RepID=UPI0018F8335A|nr:protein FAR1-RELATED SEQUENCE 9-like [Tripterygium wilfordii]
MTRAKETKRNRQGNRGENAIFYIIFVSLNLFVQWWGTAMRVMVAFQSMIMDCLENGLEDASINKDVELNMIPQIGMELNTVDDTWELWFMYGQKMGFGVCKDYVNRRAKDKVATSAAFECCKEGQRENDKRNVCDVHRWETRIDCKVKQTSKSDALAIELARDSGLTPKATHELMCVEAGGRINLGYIMEDQTTYLRSKRKRDMILGDLGCILYYFDDRKKKDSTFYYSQQLDCDDLVTNIFWADARMIVDYVAFGDVITFDTTYGTNKELRPLGVFTGFNHHREMVIFGAALLYDETIESFVWLFNTFLDAHGGKKPRTIFTDQDAAMANALNVVMKETYHGLCTWHMMQNGIKHLGCRMKEESNFFIDFKKCMFEYIDEPKFEEQWQKMLEVHNLKGNDWLSRIYNLKEKWAKCFMKHAFTLGIRSTQLSECLNKDLKNYLKCNLNISEFFKQFDRVVEEKRHKELKYEFFARQRVPPLGLSGSLLLRHASQRYTPSIFNLFKTEFNLALMAIIKPIENGESTDEYIDFIHGSEKMFKVVCGSTNDSMTCSCMKFDSQGILCCHILKVFIRLDITKIPERFILSRWTTGVKSSSILNECKPTIKEDSKQWARRLQSKLLRLTYQVAENNDLREEMEAMIEEFGKKIYNFEVKYESEAKHERIKQFGRLIGNMKGLKKREGQRRTRRLKPPYEKRQGKGKKSSSSNLATSELVTTSQPNEFSQASQVSFFYLNIEPGQEFLSLLASTLHLPLFINIDLFLVGVAMQIQSGIHVEVCKIYDKLTNYSIWTAVLTALEYLLEFEPGHTCAGNPCLENFVLKK